SALMTSAYRMTAHGLDETTVGAEPTEPRSWRFLKVEPFLRRTRGEEEKHEDVLVQLSVSARRMFKIWRLSPLLRALGLAGAVAAVIALAILSWTWRAQTVATVEVGHIAAVAAVGLLSILVGPMVWGVLTFRNFLWRALAAVSVLPVG